MRSIPKIEDPRLRELRRVVTGHLVSFIYSSYATRCLHALGLGFGPLQGSTDIHRISLTHVAEGAGAGALVNWFVSLSVLSSQVLVFYLSFVATVFVCFRLWSNSMHDMLVSSR